MSTEIAQKDVKLQHDKIAEAYHRRIYTRSSLWLIGKKIANLAKISKEDLVLDVGCGSGRCTIPVRFDLGAKIVGVDISLELLKILRCLSKKEIPVILADATFLPFRDGAFDRIISNYVWIHIPTSKGRRKYVCEMSRVLKTGGYLFLTGIRRSMFLSKDTWARSLERPGSVCTYIGSLR